MSYLDPFYTQCEDLQGRLADYWSNPQHRAELREDRSPFLEFVTSPANQNGINQVVSPGSGKVRTINLISDRPLLESSVTTESNRDCRVAEKRGDMVTTYTIDTSRVFESSERFAIADFTTKCEGNRDFLLRRLLQHYIAIDKKVATVTATEAAALFGNYSADVIAAESLAADDVLVVETLDANGNYKAGAMEKIQWAADASQMGAPVVFGGRLISEHMRLAMAGCCTQYGIDVADLMSLYGFASAYDRRVATALGNLNTRALIASLGTFQLLTYLENPAVQDLAGLMPGGYIYTTAVTPAGVPVEVTIKDDCKVLDIQVQTSTKLVAPPLDLYEAGDNFEGTNGSSSITVTNL